jgi:hypothetical protein
VLEKPIEIESVALIGINLLFTVAGAFGVYVIRGIQAEINRSREKISDLYVKVNAILVDAEKVRGEVALGYVKLGDFKELKTEFFDKLSAFEERFDKKLEKLMDRVHDGSRSNGHPSA